MTETGVSFSLSCALCKVQVDSIFTSLSSHFNSPTSKVPVRTTIISRTRYSWHRDRRQTSQQLLFRDWELCSFYLILLDLKLHISCNPPSRSVIQSLLLLPGSFPYSKRRHQKQQHTAPESNKSHRPCQ